MESLAEENVRLRQEVAELKSSNERLQRRVGELERRVEELLRTLEESQRAGKRQAAPFSRRAGASLPAGSAEIATHLCKAGRTDSRLAPRDAGRNRLEGGWTAVVDVGLQQ